MSWLLSLHRYLLGILGRTYFWTGPNLNPILAEDEVLLLSYYKKVRATWSASAIKNLQKAKGLKMSKHSGLRETEIIRISIAEYWNNHDFGSDLEKNQSWSELIGKIQGETNGRSETLSLIK